ncbi:MAG: class I SAM-dependent methyltransferase [Nitrospira sp.]|nr:class I SAM-dependent methyltransferase [Nitrospira sp.]
MVDALAVWSEFSCRDFVRDAEDFFRRCGHADPWNAILKQGSTDFDTKYTDNPDEKPTYKTDLYISKYMDLHIRQNRTVLEKYLDKTLRNRMHIVFVDFGCGPMTSGLVLAEILSKHDEDYKKKLTYLGIDASQNMVERAKWINDNEQHKIFAPDRFGIVQGTTFDFSDSVVEETLGSTTQVDLAVLCMSFVLAPPTNRVRKDEQPSWARDLAEKWHQWISRLPNLHETEIVYLNPGLYDFHLTWKEFTKALKKQGTDGAFSYESGEIEYVPVPGLKSDVASALIIGRK